MTKYMVELAGLGDVRVLGDKARLDELRPDVVAVWCVEGTSTANQAMGAVMAQGAALRLPGVTVRMILGQLVKRCGR